MSKKTLIQFAHHTWSPWRGCEHAYLMNGTEHPGCKNCYAEEMSHRNPTVLGEWGPEGTRAIGAESYLKLPYQWDRAAKAAGERRRVFPSLMDPFENRSDLEDFRHGLFRTIDDCPNLDFLLFTKRARWIRALWPGGYRKNVWLVYSASDQGSLDEGMPHLMRCRALVPVLGLSAEPLIGPITFRPYSLTERPCFVCKIEDQLHDPRGSMSHPINCGWRHDQGREYVQGIDWVIVGGESGPRARPCDIAWIRSIKEQCQEAGVACFVKQLGTRPIASEVVMDTDRGIAGSTTTTGLSYVKDKKGGDMAEWPEDLPVREFPRVTI